MKNNDNLRYSAFVMYREGCTPLSISLTLPPYLNYLETQQWHKFAEWWKKKPPGFYGQEKNNPPLLEVIKNTPDHAECVAFGELGELFK